MQSIELQAFGAGCTFGMTVCPFLVEVRDASQSRATKFESKRIRGPEHFVAYLLYDAKCLARSALVTLGFVCSLFGGYPYG